MTTDEELSRYLDGELAEGESDSVRRAVAADPGLAARLERLRAVDRTFADAVRAIDAAPLPAAVAAMLAEPAPRMRPRLSAVGWRLPAALAATLAIGVFGGAALSSFNRPQMTALAAGPSPAGSRLSQALDTAASGSRLAVGDATLHALVSFRTSAGALCREFRFEHGASGAHGVACRHEGAWTVQVAAAAPPESEGAYRAASTDAAIDAFVADIMSGDVLGADEERAALKNRADGG